MSHTSNDPSSFEDLHGKSPSIRDVARHVGVSSQTVSRVVNGNPHVSPATRRKVQTALRDMGYRQNRTARTLRLGKSRTLGLLISYLETSGNAMLLKSITDSAFLHDYAVTLIPAQDDVSKALAANRDFIASQHFDGLIIVSGFSIDESATGILPGLETVLIGSMERSATAWTTVDTDQRQISQLAVNHLLSLGHRTVHHIRGDNPSVAARLREEGWRSALVRRSRYVPRPEPGDWTADSGYAAGMRLADAADCTAIYASNDTMALGAIQALHDRGIRVPEDVSVIGVDDSLNGIVPHNTLTTIRQNPQEIGRIAVEAIVSRLHADDHPSRSIIRVQPTLVVRSSTAQCR